MMIRSEKGCRGCEALPKCTADHPGDTTCRYLCFTYGMPEPKEEEAMIPADKLKNQIAKVKKCFTSENSDYKTGYISAISVVEGMIAYLESGERIDEQ